VGAILIDSFKVRRRRIDRTGFATVPLIYNGAPVSVSSTLTILPPR
jgi:hypothetical protein